ncbi:serine threonine protein kinase : Serine/threonine protein kinase OS=Pirellula staleyi (strain ATCC 27377 / DSM 6068 / ICPB 4128) GN=Psta_4397 PE=3 SV=1: Pkinase [Gemmataceae bacterium]|nr:serine threonine protein kinase : Serine/threonine protein kinase OS=Pirellula staleyi (strain ATCC 27377 / DSM 6068 / ICPB 4128) GN=Psta_4397 PE=3 SV=1: Pkinase [Gemmataceae bacterium]VTU01194.1 serine threonine protein kinase : Serine/threonine protein kinase OS=Pirellula staleyi (strain ATCC 27377 / DSM 6068 / ICPB 4128) GN=Psta_4397 PE=3 SV=1: Pkinase [Gemmataceae bacterium]
MPPPRTGTEVLDLVRKSGITDDGTLDKFLQTSGPLPAHPGEAAAQFLLAGILTELQAEFILKGDPTGYRVAKYVLLERIGRATGELFRARHTFAHRQATLQSWPPELSRAEQEQAAWTGEYIWRSRASLVVLDHPNIARVFDREETPTTGWWAIEHLEGKQLPSVLEQVGGRLPVGEACGCAIQVAMGLQCLHESNVSHQQINPINLFVCDNGAVKILNHWIAVLYLQNEIERDGDYLAPEQCLDSAAIDHRTDIYLLGCVLYRLLAGQVVFPEGTLAQKLIWHFNREPVPPHTVCTEVPTGLSQVVAKMMAKRPGDRYPSMTEVIAALRPFVEPAPTGDSPEMAAAALEQLAASS